LLLIPCMSAAFFIPFLLSLSTSGEVLFARQSGAQHSLEGFIKRDENES
jgi:hypothetical protein